MPSYEAFLSDAITNGRRDLVIVPDGATAPAAHTSIGEFTHDETHKSDAIYHHLRDLCYAEGIQDMQNINIKYDNEVAIIDFDLSRVEVEIEEGANTTVEVWIRPGHGNMGTITVDSDDIAVATETYDAGNRVITITGVAAGNTTVSVTLGDIEKTILVNVIEPEG